MIQQTESGYRSIRGYGCLMCCYVWMIAKQFNHNFAIKDIEALWLKAIGKEIILENDLPIDGSRGEWYRCWIKDPVAWMKLVAASIGEVVNPEMTFKLFSNIHEKAPYYIIENISRTKTKQKVINGVHFTAETDNDEYNPDVRIDIVALKSIRGWKL